MKPIRISEAEGMPQPDRNDRYVLEPKTFVQHKATSLMFKVSVDQDKKPDATLALQDFFAEFAHLCEGFAMPPASTVDKLGKDAIIVSLNRLASPSSTFP